MSEFWSGAPRILSLLFAHHDLLSREAQATHALRRRAGERAITALAFARSAEIAADRSAAFASGADIGTRILSEMLPSVPGDAPRAIHEAVSAGERIRDATDPEDEVARSFAAIEGLARGGASRLEEATRELESVLLGFDGERLE